MGYYTDFTLNTSAYRPEEWSNKNHPIPEELIPKIEDRIDEFGVFDSGDLVDGFCGTSKWYDSEEDMRQLSSEFPGILFRIDGQGENPEDMWKAYYLNGKEQKVFAKITFDGFSPKMLR